MNLSIFARNLRGPFMIHPMQAAAVLPLVHGILAGNEVDVKDDEQKASRKVSCSDFITGGTLPAAGQFAGKSVFVTYLEGTMSVYDTCESYGTRRIAGELLAADADPEVIGHIIVADSGGGAADSVPEIADAIQQLTKPIVAFVDGMAASACIYAISYCRQIIAHRPMNQVGCVGTMITVSGWPKFRRDADGYVKARIYASQSDEKNADYEAALEGNVQLIREELLDPLCELFIKDMKANRPNATDDQLKGRTFFAKDVVGSLIDSIGSFEDAVQAVMALASEDSNQSSSQMARYSNLESVPELSEQVYAEDGSTVLQECQLQALDAALGSRTDSDERQAELDRINADHQAVVDGLNDTIAQRDATIAERDARINELQSALDAAVERSEGEQPAAVQVDADPANGSHGDKPAQTREEAEAACREFINRNKTQ